MSTPRSSRRRAALALAPFVAVLALAACDDDGPDVVAPGTATPTGSTEPSGTSAQATSEATATTEAATTAPESAPSSSGEAGGAEVSADQLDGRTFVATGSTGHELVEDGVVLIGFADGAVTGTGGCNSFIATPYSVADGVLTVEGPMGMTQMACDPADLMDQDTWLSELLTAEPQIALDGDTLTLTTDEDEVTFTDQEVTDPDQELTGTTWELESLVSADAVSSVPAGVRTPTLLIEGDLVLVDTGCNTARGGVEVTDSTLAFEPLATTRMACPGDASDVETAVLTVLDGTVDYELDGDQLTLTNGDDGLVYRAAS